MTDPVRVVVIVVVFVFVIVVGFVIVVVVVFAASASFLSLSLRSRFWLSWRSLCQSYFQLRHFFILLTLRLLQFRLQNLY